MGRMLGGEHEYTADFAAAPPHAPPRAAAPAERAAALARMRSALSEIVVDGISTNVPLHQDLCRDKAFMDGGTDIHYLERKLAQ